MPRADAMQLAAAAFRGAGSAAFDQILDRGDLCWLCDTRPGDRAAIISDGGTNPEKFVRKR
jgi:hypothetical protein